MNPNKNNQHQPDFINGLVLGSLIGAVAYYLYSTDDGKKTKKKLLKKGELFLQDLQEAIDQAKKESKKIAKKAHKKKQDKDKKDKKELTIPKTKLASEPSEPKTSSAKPGPKKKTKKAFSKNGKKLK